MTNIRRLVLGLIAFGLALVGFGAPAQAADPSPTITVPAGAVTTQAAPSNTIYNTTGIGIGVMHNWDGVYTHGNYDVVLPSG